MNEWISCCNGCCDCDCGGGGFYCVFAPFFFLFFNGLFVQLHTIRVIIANKCNETDSFPFSSYFFIYFQLRSVEDKPVYGENYVSDYRIHFSIVQVKT